MMLSDGRLGVDNVYSLKEGIANFALCYRQSNLMEGESRYLDSAS